VTLKLMTTAAAVQAAAQSSTQAEVDNAYGNVVRTRVLNLADHRPTA
jgi:hypothetical protein